MRIRDWSSDVCSSDLRIVDDRDIIAPCRVEQRRAARIARARRKRRRRSHRAAREQGAHHRALVSKRKNLRRFPNEELQALTRQDRMKGRGVPLAGKCIRLDRDLKRNQRQESIGDHIVRIGVKVRTWSNWRSEEHKSGLQSLMRISYAVFCLKKKNNT